MKNFNIMGIHRKIQFLGGKKGGGVHGKPIYWGELPKKGGVWTVCRFNEGGEG